MPSTPQSKTPQRRGRGGSRTGSSTKAAKKTTATKATRKGTEKTEKAKEAGVEQDAVDWEKDNYKLSLSLMTAITDDKTIQDALFPKVGPNPSTKAGGGKPKTDHYWEICKVLFTDHPDHKAAFALALEGAKKERGPWTTKIKNRLNRMVGIVNKGCQTLGQTGEGIRREEDITDELPEGFRNKWEELKAKCPYYFQLLDLIAERPNRVPTGLGNSETPIQDGILFGDDLDNETGGYEGGVDGDDAMGQENGSESQDMVEGSAAEGDEGGDGEGRASDGDVEAGSSISTANVDAGESDDQMEVSAGQKRKSKSGTAKPKTSARPGTSTPVSETKKNASEQATSKKFKGALVFEELAKSEDKTRRMELQVEAEKWRFNTKKLEAKLERERSKTERERNKVEFLRLKIELRRLRHGANDSASSHPTPSSSGLASGSQTPSVARSEEAYGVDRPDAGAEDGLGQNGI